MFEQEINETIQRITRDVLQGRTLVPLAEILEEQRIPERFKAFFETESRWWVYTEAVARARDRRFDFSHPELESLLNYLEQIQVRHARFEQEDFNAVLDSAVKLTYNYLCRPQTTLKWYVFRGEPTKPLGETLLRMDAFLDYPYFRTVFSEWVERKKAERSTFDNISAKEFERIIRRIDDQILLSCTIDDLLGLMDPLFEFVGKGEARSVPVEAMIVFFDDKNIHKLVEILERQRGHRSHITRDSFVLLMEELLSSSEEEPETDFSTVYQDDALDEVVREHLESGSVDDGVARRVVDSPASVSGESFAESNDATNGAQPDQVVAVETDVVDTSVPEAIPQEAQAVQQEEFAVEDDVDAVEAVAETDEHEVGDDYVEEPTQPVLPDVHPSEVIEDPITSQGRSGVEGFLTDVLPESYMTESLDEREESLFDDPPQTVPTPAVSDADSALSVGQETEQSNGSTLEEQTVVPGADIDDGEPLFDFLIEAEENALDADVQSHSVFDEVVPDDISEEVEEVVQDEVEEDVDEQDEEQSLMDAENSSPQPDVDVDGAEPEINIEDLSNDEEDDGEDEEIEAEAEVSEKQYAVTPATSSSSSRLTEVQTHIDAMLERKVVKKVFNRNRKEYEAALAQLNASPTWREASRILDELFIRYDVDPYSRIAIRFTDSVYGRYLTPVAGE